MLSAVSPDKMPLVLQNIRKVLKVREATGWDISQFVHLTFTCQTLWRQIFFFFSSQMVMFCSEIMASVTLLRLVYVAYSSLFIYLWFNKENERESQWHQKVGHGKSFMTFYFLNYSMILLLLAVIQVPNFVMLSFKWTTNVHHAQLSCKILENIHFLKALLKTSLTDCIEFMLAVVTNFHREVCDLSSLGPFNTVTLKASTTTTIFCLFLGTCWQVTFLKHFVIWVNPLKGTKP